MNVQAGQDPFSYWALLIEGDKCPNALTIATHSKNLATQDLARIFVYG